MPTRTHSADPRAERVRTLLRDAAFALAHERPVDEITVGDLVARAGVSRQVFYRHFTDRDDAVATAFAVAFAAAAADIRATPGRGSSALFAFAAEHRAMYRNVVPERRHPARGRGVPRRTAARLRGDRRPGHARRRPDRRRRTGSRQPLPGRRLPGGAAVLDGRLRTPTDLRGRVTAALDTVDALLGLPAATH